MGKFIYITNKYGEEQGLDPTELYKIRRNGGYL